MADSSEKESKSVDFSVGDSSDKAPRRESKRLSNRRGSRRSSFFQNLSQSFRRSGGERGADVDTLRGKHGPDFEGDAIISRGGPGAGCGCFGGNDNKQRLILIKGPFIFVYNNESDKAPKYAISLAHMKAKIQKQSGGLHVVTLETTLGDVEYEFSFQEQNIAKLFADAVKEQAAAGEAEEVRKRLGHENLLTKRASVRYAEKVAMKKIDDQPEKEERLTAEEIARVTGNPAMPM